MGVRIVLFRIEIRLMIEQAVQDVGGIPLRALDRDGIEGGVVVRNEGIKFQGVVPQAVTIGPPQDPTGKEKPLAIAARGAPIPPDLRGVEGRDGIDDIGQGRSERLLMQIPVRDLLDVGIGHIRGQACHGLRAEIAAIGHDGRDDLADVVRRARRALAQGQEVPGPVEALIDREEEVGEADRGDLVPEPRAQTRHARFLGRAQGLGGIGRQAPPVWLDGHI